MNPLRHRIGIDLGGTKTELIVLDAEGGERLRRRIATPREYRGSIDAITRMVLDAEDEVGAACTVGIGIPGSLSPRTGCVRNANSVWLNGHPLKADLQTELDREIRLENDANCFAVSEAIDGAGSGAASVMGVIIGTGVGAGLVLRGRLHAGANNIGGEWGHNPLPPASQCAPASDDTELPGPACYCGRRGCIETWLSGPSFATDHRRNSPEGAVVSSITVIDAMRAGDVAAQASFARYVDRMARALATVINLLDPEVIVLGGGMSNISELYEQVPRQWRRYIFSDQVVTKLVRNRHGDSSGVRGAAWLWPADGA